MTRDCAWCGSPFVVTTRNGGGNRHIFCTKKCANASYNRRHRSPDFWKATCQLCLIEFDSLKPNHARYCSNACRSKAYRIRVKEGTVVSYNRSVAASTREKIKRRHKFVYIEEEDVMA